MGNKQGKWIPEEQQPRQPGHPDKQCPALESCVDKPETQDAAVQAQESSAPTEMAQEGQLTGEAADASTSREVPPVPDPGDQAAGQMMKQHPSESQEGASNDNMPAPVAYVEMASSGETEPDHLQGTTEGRPHLMQFPHLVAILDNESNTRLEAQMEEEP